MVQAFTVYYGLVTLGAMREGSTVLVHSAAGGCGLNALAICDALGATAVGAIEPAQRVCQIRCGDRVNPPLVCTGFVSKGSPVWLTQLIGLVAFRWARWARRARGSSSGADTRR